MKYVTVLRHAQSSWGDAGLDDFDRPLNGRGRKAAKAIGEELKPRFPGLDLVLASPAARSRETLERLELGYGNLPEIRFEQILYLADVQTLLRQLRLLNDGISRVLLVGHNPGLQSLVLELSRPSERLRPDVVEKFPTAATAILEIPVNRWRDVRPGTAEILALIFPRELD